MSITHKQDSICFHFLFFLLLTHRENFSHLGHCTLAVELTGCLYEAEVVVGEVRTRRLSKMSKQSIKKQTFWCSVGLI